jgi:hypothetical protein
MALTLTDLKAQGLLRELARVFGSEDEAAGLLLRIGMPRERLPIFRAAGNPLNFWRQAAHAVEDGVTAGGLEALLAVAAEDFPHNPRFARFARFAPGRTGAPRQPDPPARRRMKAARPAVPRAGDPAGPAPRRDQQRDRVFVCYARDDKPQVMRLYQRLQGDGLEPWIDAVDLLPGEIWEPAIKRVITEQSHAVIVCLSRRAIEKIGYVQEEIRMALDILGKQPEGRIFLIPARLEECTLPHRLQHINSVDLFLDGGYEKLLAALRTHQIAE